MEKVILCDGMQKVINELKESEKKVIVLNGPIGGGRKTTAKEFMKQDESPSLYYSCNQNLALIDKSFLRNEILRPFFNEWYLLEFINLTYHDYKKRVGEYNVSNLKELEELDKVIIKQLNSFDEFINHCSYIESSIDLTINPEIVFNMYTDLIGADKMNVIYQRFSQCDKEAQELMSRRFNNFKKNIVIPFEEVDKSHKKDNISYVEVDYGKNLNFARTFLKEVKESNTKYREMPSLYNAEVVLSDEQLQDVLNVCDGNLYLLSTYASTYYSELGFWGYDEAITDEGMKRKVKELEGYKNNRPQKLHL